MKEALYLNDSYLKEFEAVVQEASSDKYIILDQTAFYPNSGGQPNDTGKIISSDDEYNILYVGKFDGKISHEVAESLALREYVEYKKVQDKNYISDFDKLAKKLLKKVNK